ncbi:hypothetical protein LSI54_09100 [Nesterenkonia sp. AY15]|uniref:hypothetical protein n=1 Tax=Nesterenkonia sp. AY15 TaxID=2901139 RepID=UPI001F4C7269|nr:hypothetical protein [Nesterenkonia sp. AY15]MCH8571507.1 hypothetical protein [Nesterenkonia sp. AY15]
MSNLYEAEVEYFNDSPKEDTTSQRSAFAGLKARNVTLRADRDLWRARAQENSLHLEQLKVQLRTWEARAKENHKQVMGMKDAHRKRLSETRELRAEVEQLRKELENR